MTGRSQGALLHLIVVLVALVGLVTICAASSAQEVSQPVIEGTRVRAARPGSLASLRTATDLFDRKQYARAAGHFANYLCEIDAQNSHAAVHAAVHHRDAFTAHPPRTVLDVRVDLAISLLEVLWESTDLHDHSEMAVERQRRILEPLFMIVRRCAAPGHPATPSDLESDSAHSTEIPDTRRLLSVSRQLVWLRLGVLQHVLSELRAVHAGARLNRPWAPPTPPLVAAHAASGAADPDSRQRRESIMLLTTRPLASAYRYLGDVAVDMSQGGMGDELGGSWTEDVALRVMQWHSEKEEAWLGDPFGDPSKDPLGTNASGRWASIALASFIAITQLAPHDLEAHNDLASYRWNTMGDIDGALLG